MRSVSFCVNLTIVSIKNEQIPHNETVLNHRHKMDKNGAGIKEDEK